MNFQPTVIPNAGDQINALAVFGEIKKVILSKDFKGGKVSNVCGTTELDFTNADLNGVAVLDISQGLGQTKIIVPADWRIESDISQVFAVVDDNRNNVYQTRSSDKVLVLKGVSIFSGVEILGCL